MEDVSFFLLMAILYLGKIFIYRQVGYRMISCEVWAAKESDAQQPLFFFQGTVGTIKLKNNGNHQIRLAKTSWIPVAKKCRHDLEEKVVKAKRLYIRYKHESAKPYVIAIT